MFYVLLFKVKSHFSAVNSSTQLCYWPCIYKSGFPQSLGSQQHGHNHCSSLQFFLVNLLISYWHSVINLSNGDELGGDPASVKNSLTVLISVRWDY